MRLKGKHIFVVEDNVENRIVYQMIFLHEGAIVEFERWGPEAVSKLRHFNMVELIILDLMLTRGSSGYLVFEEIRALPEFDDVPIIAVSAADASDAIPRTQQMGFSGFISKPINQAKFADQLLQIMQGTPVWSEA